MGFAERAGGETPLASGTGTSLVLVRGPSGGPAAEPCGFVHRVRLEGVRAWVLGIRSDAATIAAVATCLGLLAIDQSLGVIPSDQPSVPGMGLLLRDGSVRGALGLLSERAQGEVRRVAYGLVRHEQAYVWKLASTLRDGRASAGLGRVPDAHPLRNDRVEQYLAPEPPLASLLADSFRRQK